MVGAVALICLMVLASPLHADSARSRIREGNGAYEREDYAGAEVQYRKALEEEAGIPEGNFNLGAALYRQGRFEESGRRFEEVGSVPSRDNEVRARALYNRGNALYKGGAIEASVDAYIRSLELDPGYLDAKHNLLCALKQLREERERGDQPREPQPTEGSEKEKGAEGDQDAQEKQKPQSSKEETSGEGEPEEMSSSPRETEGQELEPDEARMPRGEAERILEALEASEEEVQKKLRAVPGGRVKVEKDW